MKANKFWLVLGGTSDAKELAINLHSHGLHVIYSIAGLVRHPDMPCELRAGGFTAEGGLKAYVATKNVAGIINATHPYSETMTRTAAQVCAEEGLPYWRYLRPEWQATKDDRWQTFKTWTQILSALMDKRSIFFTSGQLDAEVLKYMAEVSTESTQKFLVRTAVPMEQRLPSSVTWIQGIGPFNEEDEIQRMCSYQVDALVCKNSGGLLVQSKLIAARKLNIPVYFLRRPVQPSIGLVMATTSQCVEAVIKEANHV